MNSTSIASKPNLLTSDTPSAFPNPELPAGPILIITLYFFVKYKNLFKLAQINLVVEVAILVLVASLINFLKKVICMVKLWRCMICGDPYIGDAPPANCPFCGAHQKYIVEAKKAKVSFDENLDANDRFVVEESMNREASNTAFYFCAAEKTDDSEGKLLFKALAKVEAEHANVWRKLLKLPSAPKGGDPCHSANKENLQESHDRETKTIGFYNKSLGEVKNQRVKQILNALIEIETDHLHLSEERLK